jgi:hypothetical protein
MARQRHPAHFEQLIGPDAYDRLRFYARQWAKGAYNCIVVVGPPGRLKSSIVKRESPDAHLIECNASPFHVYGQLQAHANESIILDDANGLYADANGQRLLKALTNPRKPTTVAWNTTAAKQAGLAESFQTSSRVCIIDNAWNFQNEHIEAMEDRARLFLFAPPPLAVHQQMAEEDWFDDPEIYSFIGEHLYWIRHEFDPKTLQRQGKGLSVRLYVKAQEAKRAGEDWREFILGQLLDDPADVAFLAIEADPNFQGASREEKCLEWRRRTGKARSTYYDHKRQLMSRLLVLKSGTHSDLVGRLSLEADPPLVAED